MILAPTLTLSAGSGAAIARPTFSRDFAGEKTLNNGTGPAITFTRASNATFFDASGVLQTASNDAPRFDHDPATGASRGLLIEESRTNLLLRSEEIDNASWGGTNVTVSSNAGTSPAGTTTADAILETVDNGVHERRQSLSIATTGNHTFSVFLKANGRNFVTIFVREGSNSGTTYASVTVNLSDGTISGSPTGTALVTSVGNGWYRVAVSGSVDSGTRWAQIRLREDASTTSYAGDITKGVLAWGAQLEAGAFPTSYIPTTTATATRSADSAVVTPISGFYNQSEGTLFAEFQARSLTLLSASSRRVAALYDSGSNQMLFAQNGTNNGALFSATTGTTQWSISINAGDILSSSKIAGAFALNSAQLATAGLLGTEDTSCTIPAVDTLGIGRSATSGSINSIYIRKLAYYPRRLSNTLLEQLTT